jgi:hypothetical protein
MRVKFLDFFRPPPPLCQSVSFHNVLNICITRIFEWLPKDSCGYFSLGYIRLLD